MVKYKKIPYPAEGFFRLYFFWPNQFQTSDIVLQPSFIQSFESWNFILLNGYNELQRDNKAHQWAKYTKPVQPWHPAQTSKQQWMCEQWITMQGGKKKHGLCHYWHKSQKTQLITEKASIYQGELKTKVNI